MITRRRRTTSLLVAVAATITAVGHAPTASASAPVLGAGSTFAAVALEAWAGDLFGAFGLTVTYSGIGSAGGLNQFQENAVDFASSDVPYAEGAGSRRGYQYVPIVAGGTALMYNLWSDDGQVQITNLRLSSETVAAMFFGNIPKWNDPQIVADNPALADILPNAEIKLAVRTGGSGTTGVFTDFLSSVDPAGWADFVARGEVVTQAGGNYTTDWPTDKGSFRCKCSAFPGSSEIANWIAQNTTGARNTIGYAETAYAIQNRLPVAAIRNAAGYYRLPTAGNVAIALTAATENGDGTQNLENVFGNPAPETYPASSYNYLVIPTGTDLTAEKGATIGQYVIYSVTEGQRNADFLGYSPLPPNLVGFALAKVPLINGAPEPPPLGDWGRFYEQLEIDSPTEPPPPDPVPQAPGAGGGGNAGAGGGGNAGAGGDGNASGGDAGTVDGGAGADDDGATAGADGSTGSGTQTGSGSTTRPGSGTASTTGTVGSNGTLVGGGSQVATGPVSTLPDGTLIDSATGEVLVDQSGAPLTPGSVGQLGGGVVVAGLPAGAIALNTELMYDDDNNVVGRDGQKVPKVDTISIGELLAIALTLIAIVLTPPLLIGLGVFRRRSPATA